MPRRPNKPARGADAGMVDPASPAGAPKPDGFCAESKLDPFDLWLRSSLRETFDAIAAEPIPEDLLRMIEEDRAERERIRQRRAVKPKG